MAHTIDYGNPITSGLVAAYVFVDGNTDNLVNGSDTLTIMGDAFLDSDGLNSPNSGTYTGASLSSPPSNFKPSSITIMWFGKILGNGDITGNPLLAGIFHNSSNSSPYVSYGIARSALGQGNLYAFYSEGSNTHNINIGSGIDTGSYGTPVNYLMTRTSGATEIFRDGSSLGSDSTSGSISYDSTALFRVNNHIAGSPYDTNSCNTNTALVFIWDRVLTGTEIANISSDPYFFLLGGTIHNATCQIGLSLEPLSNANIIKNSTCAITFSLNQVALPTVTINASCKIDLGLEVNPKPTKTTNATCTITNELSFDIIGQISSVELECISGKDQLPSEAGSSDNLAYFS